MAAALIDRLMHHCSVVNIRGKGEQYALRAPPSLSVEF